MVSSFFFWPVKEVFDDEESCLPVCYTDSVVVVVVVVVKLY